MPFSRNPVLTFFSCRGRVCTANHAGISGCTLERCVQGFGGATLRLDEDTASPFLVTTAEEM
jgi:hypothetical protein